MLTLRVPNPLTVVTIMMPMEQTNVLLGKRITRAREARRWSRSDLARRAGVDPSYVTRIEEAHYKRPSVDKVTAVANALGIRVTDLTEPEQVIAPPSVEETRAVLIAKGFKAHEAPVVDQILSDIVSHEDEDERREILDAVSVIMGRRHR